MKLYIVLFRGKVVSIHETKSGADTAVKSLQKSNPETAMQPRMVEVVAMESQK